MTVEKKRLLAAVIASTASLMVAMVYSLSSSRLALIYVGTEGFGLIGLIAQIITYLTILDLGLSMAFNRLLIDYRQESEERFASGLKTARLVFHSLGLIGTLCAALLGCFGGKYLNIPPSLTTEFRNILLVQGLSVYLSFAAKPIVAPLIASGRQDLVGWISTGSLVVNTIVMSLGFVFQVGIYSVLLGILFSGLFYLASTIVLARYHLNISIRGVGFDREIFKEVRAFARDTLFWHLGRSCMYLLPTLLMSGLYGIILVADLSGGMKMVLLLISICTRLPDMAVAPLSIQASSGSPEKAIRNFLKVSEVTGALGVLGGIFIACANPSFVNWWMLGKLHWPALWNLFAGLWLVFLILGRCFSGYAVVTKQLEIIRFVPIWQCLFFGVLILALQGTVGPFSLILALPISEILVVTLFVYRLHHKTNLNAGVMLPIVFRQLLVCAAGLTLSVYGAHLLEQGAWSPLHQFILAVLLFGIIGLIALPLLLRTETRRDLMLTLNAKFRRRPV